MDKPFLELKTTVPFVYINKKIVKIQYYTQPYKIVFITDKNEKLSGVEVENAFDIWLGA